MTAAAMKDEQGGDFLIVSLPTEYITTEDARQRWRDFFLRQFQFPVVIAFGQENDETCTLDGDKRLLDELLGCNAADFPWQIVPVNSQERPPITYYAARDGEDSDTD